jgi:hypothetical protein
MNTEFYFEPLDNCCKCGEPACYELVALTEVRPYGRSAYYRETRKPYCSTCAAKSNHHRYGVFSPCQQK